MPVRHRDEEYGELTPPEPKRCKYCDECGVSCGANGGEPGWRVTLDHDLVETLSAIYPEWFKPQRSGSPSPHSSQTSDDTSCESGDMSSVPPQPPSPPRDSPPKVVVDASPLQPAMDKNKESLKVKLMMRRPITTLVDQGIMPPLKTPPAYYEQRKQLERAKTGDLLKAKIQKRPDRQELERRHILESQEGHLDPSLAEKQRMLKKARLADQLNDQLSHRPGPLELIKKNILHTEEPIEIAVKQGLLNFKATCEGLIGRPEHPSSYCGPPDESPAHSPPSVCSVPSPPSTSTSTLSPESIASPQPHSVSGKDKIRKKLKHKPKEQPKQRPIKFHVYTGPPNAPKQSSPPHNTLESAETSYQLLLQQQKMFLEFMLSGTPKSQSPSPPRCDPPPPPPLPPQANTPPTRFEEMKVSDLRSELKRRNLPVSGPKPILVERLRVHLGEIDDVKSPASVVSHDSRSESMERELNCQQTQMTQHLSDDIVAEQRRQIEDLQRKLEASRRQIEEMRREATSATTQIGNSSDQPKKILQAKIKESQIRAQLEALQGPTQTITVNHSQLQHQTPRNIAAIPQTITAIPQSITTTPQAITTAIKPSYVMYTMDGGLFAVRQAISEPQSVNSDSGNTPTATKIIINGMEVPIMFVQQASAPQPAHASPPAPPPPPPPPQQEQPSMEESHIMDDVLQILVENGELPATVIGDDDDCTDFLMSDFLGGRDEGENERLRRELDDIQNELLRQVDLHGVGNDDADVVDLNYNWERGLLADEPMDVCPALGDEPMDATSPAPLLDPDILYAPPTSRDPLLAGRLSCAAPAPPVKHYSWDKFEFDTT